MRDATQQGPACEMGDKIGVGIRAIDEHARPERRGRQVFFTKNGQEVHHSFELFTEQTSHPFR